MTFTVKAFDRGEIHAGNKGLAIDHAEVERRVGESLKTMGDTLRRPTLKTPSHERHRCRVQRKIVSKKLLARLSWCSKRR